GSNVFGLISNPRFSPSGEIAAQKTMESQTKLGTLIPTKFGANSSASEFKEEISIDSNIERKLDVIDEDKQDEKPLNTDFIDDFDIHYSEFESSFESP